jgi:hypothetical protein
VLWETPNNNGATVLEYVVRNVLPMGFLKRRFTVDVADDEARAFEKAASLYDDGGATPLTFDPKASTLVQGDLQLLLTSEPYPTVDKFSSQLMVATTRQYQLKLAVRYVQVRCFVRWIRSDGFSCPSPTNHTCFFFFSLSLQSKSIRRACL